MASFCRCLPLTLCSAHSLKYLFIEVQGRLLDADYQAMPCFIQQKVIPPCVRDFIPLYEGAKTQPILSKLKKATRGIYLVLFSLPMLPA